MTRASAPQPPMMILEQLGKAKSKARIKKIIEKAWDSDSEGFFVGIQLALDKDIPVPEKVPAWDGEDSTPGSITMEEFYSTLQDIKHKKITDIKKTVTALAEKSGTDEWNKWYRRILTKELTSDLPMETIIDVLKELTSPKKAL